ncbi:hypothetical protein E3Z10_20330 [Escherichia albertii]|nr:hypothetical protein [Escherichia albertii]
MSTTTIMQAGDCATIAGAGRKNCFCLWKIVSLNGRKNEGTVTAPSVSMKKNQARMVSSLASTSLMIPSGMRSSRLPFRAPISMVLG